MADTLKGNAAPDEPKPDEPKPIAQWRLAWRDHLEESSAWQVLSTDVDLVYEKDNLRSSGPIDRDVSRRLASLARDVLEAHGYRVSASGDDGLRVHVEGGE
jgi:hypothetical protein